MEDAIVLASCSSIRSATNAHRASNAFRAYLRACPLLVVRRERQLHTTAPPGRWIIPHRTTWMDLGVVRSVRAHIWTLGHEQYALTVVLGCRRDLLTCLRRYSAPTATNRPRRVAASSSCAIPLRASRYMCASGHKRRRRLGAWIVQTLGQWRERNFGIPTGMRRPLDPDDARQVQFGWNLRVPPSFARCLSETEGDAGNLGRPWPRSLQRELRTACADGLLTNGAYAAERPSVA